MPKMKTHRGAAKRFKVTAGGKLQRNVFKRKAVKRNRRQVHVAEVTGGDKATAKRMLGI